MRPRPCPQHHRRPPDGRRLLALVGGALALVAGGAGPRRLAAQESGNPSFVAAGAPRGDPLDFPAALARARAANERVLAAAAAVERAEAERGAARGRRLPDVGIAARQTRIDAPIVIDLDPIRRVLLGLNPQVPPGAVPPFVSQVQKQAFTYLTLNATAPLFAGGRLQAGVRAATAAVDAAREQARGTAGEVATELAQRYFGLQLATAARATREGLRANLVRHLEQARALERNGQIARAERLRAEVALAEADRELSQARRDEQTAGLALAATLALDEPPLPTTPLFRVADLPPLTRFREAALAANPALARLAAERARAAEGVRAARGELLPSVGLFAQRELYTRDLTILQPNWAVGLMLNVPLFQGGQRLAHVEGARAATRQLDFLAARARRDVMLLVEQRYAQVEEARAQLRALEAVRALAEESLRAQRRAFGAGLATSLDVLDAEQALARVRLGQLRARHDADVALAALLETTGESERMPTYVQPGEDP